MPVIAVFKKEGETPLQCLERLRTALPKYKDEVLSYAGRLDPMAEGVMLILVGREANQHRSQYLALDKEYEVELLLGFETDTHDILGLVDTTPQSEIAEKDFVAAFEAIPHEFEQNYPAYSSKTVNGVALFELTREGKLALNERPRHKVVLTAKHYLGYIAITNEELSRQIKKRIALVHGDFRQTAIVEAWERTLKPGSAKYSIFKVKLVCGSGFYVRMLAHDLGRQLKTGCIAYKIRRTRVGEYRGADVIM